jgi:hypothetical protein
MSGVIVPPEVYLGNLIMNRLSEAERNLKGSVLNNNKLEMAEEGQIVFGGGGTKITSSEVELPLIGKLCFGMFEIYVKGESLIFQHEDKKLVIQMDKEDEDKKDEGKEKEKEGNSIQEEL